ncbi:methyltransferase domain-containing protein [uncultured Winogradskyella sp.]|uniref:methyltransferase domain-containing protein n=1 Tax=uncultured Winogradskyella sp. TaxID=395353 RepID=UPI0026052661|nr:methyltransferase domain-containing protein [uncultured Winogradskyella sp.]
MVGKDYWEKRYINNETGWDIGSVSNPLKQYIDQIKDKSLKILIPGAGNSYEAEYLWNNGFKNIYILDIAQQPLDNLKKRVPEIPINRLLKQDFFKFENQFDLIIEQTFFCAINPNLRVAYKNKMFKLLKPSGKLVGLLFNFELTESGPPFGGSKTEYQSLFQNDFKIKTLEPSINSIKQRQGKELFFIFEKKT